MTRRVPLPTDADVVAALAQLRQDNPATVTVRALAERVGLTNPTFWRHFPVIAQDLADQRRAASRARPQPTTGQVTRGDGADANLRLRAETATLRDQIDLAAAHIQRLTLENHTLRTQLEHRDGIAHLPTYP